MHYPFWGISNGDVKDTRTPLFKDGIKTYTTAPAKDWFFKVNKVQALLAHKEALFYHILKRDNTNGGH